MCFIFTCSGIRLVLANENVNFIKDVHVSSKAKELKIELLFSGQIPDYTPFTIAKPGKLVIDMALSQSRIAKVYPLGNPFYPQLRWGFFNGKLRVVVDSTKERISSYRIISQANKIEIYLPLEKAETKTKKYTEEMGEEGYSSENEIKKLKEQVQKLLKRIEELEEKQKRADQKMAKREEKEEKEEKDRFKLKAKMGEGVSVESPDGQLKFRIRAAVQFRYSYLWFDKDIAENNEDWSNFFMRRLRLFFDGNIPNKDWQYFLHIQLEPRNDVNVHDGYIQWQHFSFARLQFGRMKIPYGLEFCQSGFLLNGVERTIFSGETDVDGKARDIFGNRLSPFWPGGNANFPVSGHTLSGTLFPVGGLMLYRSQGINVNGDINVFGQKGFFQYWLGVYNGRDTQGGWNHTNDMLYVARVAINPFGKYNLFNQGDLDYSLSPKLSFLLSGYQYQDRANSYYDDEGKGYEEKYDIKDYGFNVASLFRYRGFSIDAEFGWETFEQKGDKICNDNSWERLGYRFNLGYFFIPKKWEITTKFAYVERLRDNTKADSLLSGLGLIEMSDGIMGVEKDLQQYTIGINWYIYGHAMKISADYSYLVRNLAAAEPFYSIDDQHDHRLRLMYQFHF
jgi:hypothetical protein